MCNLDRSRCCEKEEFQIKNESQTKAEKIVRGREKILKTSEKLWWNHHHPRDKSLFLIGTCSIYFPFDCLPSVNEFLDRSSHCLRCKDLVSVRTRLIVSDDSHSFLHICVDSKQYLQTTSTEQTSRGFGLDSMRISVSWSIRWFVVIYYWCHTFVGAEPYKFKLLRTLTGAMD